MAVRKVTGATSGMVTGKYLVIIFRKPAGNTGLLPHYKRHNNGNDTRKDHHHDKQIIPQTVIAQE